MASKWLELEQHGQSIWYDNVARPALESGLLERLMADDGVSGGTSNPSIFATAVTGSDLYDDDIRNAGSDESVQQVFERCAVADIQRRLRPDAPGLGAHERRRRLHLARGGGRPRVRGGRDRRSAPIALRALVDRPNVMIKVPGTAQGVDAFRRLTREGVSVNVTLLFGRRPLPRDRRGVRRRRRGARGRRRGRSATSRRSRASSSRASTRRSTSCCRRTRPCAAARRSTTPKLAYVDVFEQVFAGPRWERLAAAGARVQRPLWASTSTKNPAYAPTLYVDTLIARAHGQHGARRDARGVPHARRPAPGHDPRRRRRGTRHDERPSPTRASTSPR